MKQNPQTKALELVDYYGPSNAEWLWKRDLDMQVTPAIFDFKGKEYMIDASKECRIYLMDTESIGGDDHRTPAYRTPLICNEIVDFARGRHLGFAGHLGRCEGTRWILTPFWGPKHSKFKAPIEYGEVKKGAIAAFKMESKNGNVVVDARLGFARHGSGGAAGDRQRDDLRLWQRREHCAGVSRCGPRFPHGAPHPDVDACGAVRAGCARPARNCGRAASRSRPGITGAALALANGQVYINTYDGMLYCFGLNK